MLKPGFLCINSIKVALFNLVGILLNRETYLTQ